MVHLHIPIDHGLSRTESCSNLLAALRPCLLDLFQTHFPVAEFGTDRTTKETILVEHMDLSQVSRVVLYQHLFFDKGRQGDIM